MSVSWQNKISNFEITPPRDVWNKTASQLDEEYDPAESSLSQKMQDFEVEPPAFVFDKIIVQLEPEAKPLVRVIPMRTKRVAVAAIMVGLALVSYFYFFNSGSVTSRGTTTSGLLPATIPLAPSSPAEKIKILNDRRITPPGSSVSVPGITQVTKESNPESTDPGDRGSSVKHAKMDRLLAVNAFTPITVSAPPIYDGDGNIVMDEDLVSAPDENYIIVTSPSGQQTKISRKFLKMLCVMNGGNDNYMNAENFEWKLRFEEWKSKLLQQGSYMPTPNNFLDIMDLKELLQEN